MEVHHLLIFCFLSALYAGNSVYAFNTFIEPEGGNGTIKCYLSKPASTKFFCKNKCEGDDLLIKTDGVSAQSGRFSVKYEVKSSGKGILSVTITHLVRSDAGRYRCGLGGSLVPDSYVDFGIRVSDEFLDGNSSSIRAVHEGENFSFGCSDTVFGQRKFLCRNQCKSQDDVLIDTNDATAKSGRYSLKYDAGSTFGLYVTINPLTKSDSGLYRCGYGDPSSPDSHKTFQIIFISEPSTSTLQTTTEALRSTSTRSASTSASFRATDQPTAFPQAPPSTCLWAWGVLGPVVGVLLLAVLLLLLYIWRSRRSSGSGFNSRENACVTNVELSDKCEDSVYQDVKPSSGTQTQTYSADLKA